MKENVNLLAYRAAQNYFGENKIIKRKKIGKGIWHIKSINNECYVVDRWQRLLGVEEVENMDERFRIYGKPEFARFRWIFFDDCMKFKYKKSLKEGYILMERNNLFSLLKKDADWFNFRYNVYVNEYINLDVEDVAKRIRKFDKQISKKNSKYAAEWYLKYEGKFFTSKDAKKLRKLKLKPIPVRVDGELRYVLNRIIKDKKLYIPEDWKHDIPRYVVKYKNKSGLYHNEEDFYEAIKDIPEGNYCICEDIDSAIRFFNTGEWPLYSANIKNNTLQLKPTTKSKDRDVLTFKEVAETETLRRQELSFEASEKALDKVFKVTVSQSGKKHVAKHSEVLDVYVDGSFNKNKRYVYACVCFENHIETDRLQGYGKESSFTKFGALCGELLSALKAMEYAKKHGYKVLNIFYDCRAIFDFTEYRENCSVKTKKLREIYYKMLTYYQQFIEITFHKVKAHSGNVYNNMADKLTRAF